MSYPAILYFTSTHCAPCKHVGKMLDEVNMSLFGNMLKIEKIDIGLDLAKAQEHNIFSVPTVVIGDNKLTRIQEKDELIDAILQGFLSSVSIS